MSQVIYWVAIRIPYDCLIYRSSCITLVRMIGVTSLSMNIRTLLRYLCLQLCHVFGDDPKSIPNVSV